MPALIALAVAGVGLYAGYRWISKELERASAEAARVRADTERRAASGTVAPKDLGTLEWDDATGVYRPGGRPGGPA